MILIIEDDKTLLRSIAATLRKAGFETASANDGTRALEVAKAHLPELMICKLGLLRQDDYALLRQLRANDRLATTPVIFLADNTPRELIREAMNLGADDYLFLPIRADELLRAIQSRLKLRATVIQTHLRTMELLRKNMVFTLPHELRTPLMAILGYSQLLMSERNFGNPRVLYQRAKHINEIGMRLQLLIESYLQYTQIRLAETDAQYKEALRKYTLSYPAAVIRDQALLTASKYRRKRDLRLKLVDHPIHISEENLAKIVEELLDNAFRFSTSGSKVQITTLAEAQTYQLHIRDYGRGITPAYLEKAGKTMQFEPLVGEQQGFGLGLMIVTQLVQLYQGILALESTEGQGTLVTVTFSL
ncbi:MAG: HAMP domain-containing sensor histidine kinase [Anaerolineae bacterium]